MLGMKLVRLIETHSDHLLNQFFDRAIYYAILGHEEAQQRKLQGNRRRVQELATAIGLVEECRVTSEMVEE